MTQQRLYDLKHRDKLLADIAEQLSNHVLVRASVAHIRVRLYHVPLYGGLENSPPVKEFLGLHIALDAIINDIYWDEEGNWADANRAALDTY